MQERAFYLLALTAVQKAGPVAIARIIGHFGDTKRPFNARKEDFLPIDGLTEAVVDEILRMHPEKEAARILKGAEKAGVAILTIFDECYPALLKEIHDPPPVLYCKGKIDDQLKIAVVGTRRATPYGKAVAENLGYELGSHDITVVSGLARGIDTAAHTGALDAGGRTIAVLGCGFHHIYPKENGKLADRISESGAVITEFPLEIQPLSENFPRRNRIISGLSVATVVVEAEERSGALITANYALEQGREVFAIPGNITSSKSLGPNRLIRDGATPLLDLESILNGLPAHFLASAEKPESSGSEQRLSAGDHDDDGKSAQAGHGDSGYSESARQMGLPIRKKEALLDPDEKEILSLLTVDDPIHIDRIAELSRISINKLLGAVLSLELKGLVDQLPGNHYIKKLKR